MYCPPDGTDIGAVVADIGAHTAKLGFAGEDTPRAYFSSRAGVVRAAAEAGADGSASAMQVDGASPQGGKGKGKEASSSKKKPQYKLDLGPEDGGMEVVSPLADGLVDDWDLVEQIWEHANRTYLSVDLSQTPLLLVERSFNTPKLRQEYAELAFEKFRSPAVFLSKDAVLSCFACGKTTGLVADIGAETTTVSPVVEGWLEGKGLVKSQLGGRAMDRYLLSLLTKNGIAVQPFLRVRKGGGAAGAGAGAGAPLPSTAGWTDSYKEYARLEVVRDLKESVCRMPEAGFSDTDPKYASVPKASYELPDGTQVAAGIERFQVPELLMTPDPAAWAFLPSEEEAGPEWARDSLPKMVADACLRCDRDQQLALIGNVIMAGGGACIEGTADRLKAETETVLYGPGQGMGRVRVLQANAQERRICAWLGGSIVASLGSFHEMWVSRQEYAERGAGVVDTKCP